LIASGLNYSIAQNGENDHSQRCMAITKGEKAPVQILYIN